MAERSPVNSTLHTERTLHPAVMLIVIILAAALVVLAYLISDVSKLQAPDMPLRWVSFAIGAAAILMLYMVTRHLSAWQLDTMRLIAGVGGAILYAILLWISNGQAISSLSVSQISLRPAIAVPILFGFWFGPLTGFIVGFAGNLGGDLLSGFGVSPQWDMGNGLVGLCVGLVCLVGIKRRQRTSWAVLGAALILAVGLVIYYLANQLTPNMFISDSTPVSALLGLSPVIGMILVVTGYFSMLMLDPNRALTVVWGAFGNLIGIGFAALSDIAINQYTPAQAVVGEWIPAAGPNLIALAILVPLALVIIYAIQRRSLTAGQTAT